jgi:SAM-dependent methyltransferase
VSRPMSTALPTSATTPPPDPTDRRWWFDAWEAHMAGFVPGHEEVLRLLCDVVSRTLPPDPTVVELGAGTGSLGDRIAAARPDARVIAVDLDPLLPALGQHVLGDRDGRVVRREVDLREVAWREGLPSTVDAVVTVAALHMLGRDDTVRVLTDVAGLLRRGGLFLDLDWAAPAISDPALARATGDLAEAALAAAGPSAFVEHRAALDADPELARLEALRRARFGPPPEVEPAYLDAHGHRRALLDGGFAEVVELWRHLDLALLAASR